jgi:hypothetical protein
MDAKRQSQLGMVGFFDILGFQSFLENNEPEDAAEQVLKAIVEIPKVVPEELAKAFPESKPESEALRTHIRETKWLIFSDTILMFQYLEAGPPLLRALR